MRFVLAGILALVATSALAQTHTIDMTTVLKDDMGHAIEDQFTCKRDAKGQIEHGTCAPLTLGSAIAHSLFFVGAEEKNVTPEQKWAWAVLAEKIRKDKHAAITAPEVRLIEHRLGKMYGGIVLMRAMPLIDPNAKPPEIK